MAKKLFLIIIASAFCMNLKVRADEGMWLPLLINRLNYVDMQKKGCHLTAEEIYSVNNSSLKDAIVALNDGMCSAVMISGEGLLLTNHHCGEPFIQTHATVDKDYITDGFWAKEKTEELRNDKLSATFLIRMEDVTGKILPYVNNKMSEKKRATVVDSIKAVLKAEASKGTTYTVSVLPFFDGNEYYMFVTEVYKDVRLVGAPPEAIGEFGGDVDNWTWPREECDFSIFRVYMSPEGKPAEYSKKNVPFHPKKFLPISMKGVKKDDFAMVLGYPGTSDRFMNSYGVKVVLEKANPSIIKIREKKLALMGEDMKAAEQVQIQYKSKYDICSNYYKYFIGQSEQLEKLKVYDKKVAIENSFKAWYVSDPARKQTYENVLSEIEKSTEIQGKYTIPYTYYTEAILKSIELLSFVNTYQDFYKKLNVVPVIQDTINKLSQSLSYAAKLYFRSYNLPTDKKICIAMLQMFFKDVSPEFYPDVYSIIDKKYKGNISSFVDDMYANSIFANRDKLIPFLAEPDSKKMQKEIEKDIAYTTMLSFYNKFAEIKELYLKSKDEVAHGTRLFVKGIMDMNKDIKYYPNANHTMRLTYGKVTDYAPPGKSSFDYYTTLDLMVSREVPNNPDFTIPPKLKELYQKKDFGKYATDGVLRTCFITNNDVTGGDSGAPVIDADGNLIGLNFDINWEATSVPIFFDQNYQRSITVDVKYILFIVDKYAGATNIIKELTLVE